MNRGRSQRPGGGRWPALIAAHAQCRVGRPATSTRPLVRLNFIALVTPLDALATGGVAGADLARYESLPENESCNFYLMIQGASIVTGTGVPAFTGDIGVVATSVVHAMRC